MDKTVEGGAFPSQKKRISRINEFLLENGFLIKNNPAISHDLTLDFSSLLNEIHTQADFLGAVIENASHKSGILRSGSLILWPKSSFSIKNSVFYVLESERTGDCTLITKFSPYTGFAGMKRVGESLDVIPLWWENLIELKNCVLECDPSSTIFPKADASVVKGACLGIGARFTTLHWPAVAWVMKSLGITLNANQNSVPRELVYDVDAMLEKKLHGTKFHFIGDEVPEGHQGQSVKGITHASIITLLKYGFHRHGIPWGFDVDHQPVGGRFDAIERELVEGSLFASSITYDISPELAVSHIIEESEELEAAFGRIVTPALFDKVVRKLVKVNRELPLFRIKQIVTYLMPAIEKTVRRDLLNEDIRARCFSSEEGRKFFRELSIDELPGGETSPDLLMVCLALAEAAGLKIHYVAPNFGFRKNLPYDDNELLREKIRSLSEIGRIFDVSIGFHSGSGKSVGNYQIMGTETGGRFEIKTSGRYTYEMGRALSLSEDAGDRRLWLDWYEFTKKLAIAKAFGEDESARRRSRKFILATFNSEGVNADGAFKSPEKLRRALDMLNPSPDHVFWFEYNFLFILAGKGSAENLGDHSPDGYAQRSRFYSISDQARLLYAKAVAMYIIFLAESTGMVGRDAALKAREKLKGFKTYDDLLDDIG